jgi:hypothetical protein
MLRTFDSIPAKLQEQLDLYKLAPETLKTYFIEKYEGGAECAANKKPRETTVFYYCDYFSP